MNTDNRPEVNGPLWLEAIHLAKNQMNLGIISHTKLEQTTNEIYKTLINLQTNYVIVQHRPIKRKGF